MSKKRETPISGASSTPTFLVGIAYLILGLAGGAIFYEGDFTLYVRWFLTFAGLGLLNLFVIGRTLKAAMAIAMVKAEDRLLPTTQVLVWGGAKILVLGAVGFLAYRHGTEIPTLALLLGLLTFVMVPFFGALVGLGLEARRGKKKKRGSKKASKKGRK